MSERVLVVHEDAHTRDAIAHVLREIGYEVDGAAPPVAVTEVLDKHFDLLVGAAHGLLEQYRLQALLPLLQITETLVSETNLASLVSEMLERVHQHSVAHTVWLVMEAEASMLEVRGTTGLAAGQLAQMGRWLLTQFEHSAFPRTVVMDTFLRDQSAADPLAHTFADWARQEGWDRLVLVPMDMKDSRLGAVFAAGREGTLRTSQVDLQYLSVLVAHSGIAIENMRLYHRARAQSLTDSLTGLPNARFLRDHLPARLAEAKRGHRPFSLILLDSDSLKKVNDRLGHQAGDRLVIELAETLRGPDRGVRSSDIVVRYAGDEFVILMPDTGRQEAAVVAERLRAAIASLPFRMGDQEVQCTASLGVSTYPDDALTPDELLRSADRAMYEAKRQGKNRVTSHHTKAAGNAGEPGGDATCQLPAGSY